MIPAKLPDAVVVDANILIALCTKEKLTFQTAENAFKNYVKNGWVFFAPNLIVAEVIYVLCQKLLQGVLTRTEHEEAVEFFENYMTAISPPENGEATLIKRAEKIRETYGCSRTSDALYIALAEELTKTRATELLTFDIGFVNQSAKNAPTVRVNLLAI
ncbi:MAG: type II toxin-antitoxin system VapC family toxin [Pyrinomonadaceae bacterium]|nr:type II toxin-antitoxin system VapC family toxin [Pyrinomonadaceae bacterium]